MNNKMAGFGWICVLGGIIGLGLSAMEAEYKRHKATMQLIDTEIELGIYKIDGVLKDARIRCLEKEIAELKSGCKEEEES